MELDDPRWSELEGGDHAPFDPRPSILKLEEGHSGAWDELWERLHHQGDVGSASYAAVPLLVEKSSNWLNDWNFYALVATIEEARNNPSNPQPPAWVAASYTSAWSRLEAVALQVFPTAMTTELVASLIAVLAHSKGQLTIARIALLTEDERAEFLDEAGWG
jgi:hypothetical protein